MKNLFLCISLLGSVLASSMQSHFSVENLRSISSEDFSGELSTLEIDNEDKKLIASSVLKSQRIDLLLLGINSDKIGSALIDEIKSLPDNSEKAKIVIKILMADDAFWAGKPRVSKGERYKEIGELCLSTMNRYFPEDPVDWSEIFSKEMRNVLAADFTRVVNGEKLTKRTKIAFNPLPSHESSIESNLSFEEGWEADKDQINNNNAKPTSKNPDKFNGANESKQQQLEENGFLRNKNNHKKKFVEIAVVILFLVIAMYAYKVKKTKKIC